MQSGPDGVLFAPGDLLSPIAGIGGNDGLRRFLGAGVFTMRVVGGILLAVVTMASAVAQTRPPQYDEAERVFHGLDVDRRIGIQVLLTAAGYWQSVPNQSFSTRLFGAISRFQTENGWLSTGMLTGDQAGILVDKAAPWLMLWGFSEVTHPSRGRTIWVPTGLGLERSTTPDQITYKDPLSRVLITYKYIHGITVKDFYEGYLLAQKGHRIHYKTNKRSFFAISSTSPEGFDSYIRFHQDGPGVLGFHLIWNNANGNVAGERIATLMSGSLWSAMTGAAFIDPLFRNASREPNIASTQSPPSAPPAIPTPAPGVSDKAEQKRSSSGTGFFVDNDGHILTNAHVVEECSTLTVTADGDLPAPARLLARDSINDLALLQSRAVPSKAPSFRTDIRLGEAIAVFGYPLTTVLSRNGNFTLGNVTALAGIADDSRHVQISAPVQAGNSGGPLLDHFGNIVGVVRAKLDAGKMYASSGDIPQNVNFAIKAMVAASFLDTRNIARSAGKSGVAPLAPEDLADHAKAISVFIACE